MFYPLMKSALFALPPETAHDLTLKLASLSPALGRATGINCEDRFNVELGSLKWRFPIGLAAGLDKNAEALGFFEAQGFGAIECGTITLKGQEGNPKPRLFRYISEESLRNSMGFPNQGLLAILPRLKLYDSPTPLGANIGKNKLSTRGESIEELSILHASLGDYVDYFVVNVSSPNTPGLREFQERGYLTELFQELHSQNQHKDLYLKIAPDLEREKVQELISIASDCKLTGLIATNTTIMPDRGAGGISGKLLKERASSIHKTILESEAPLELIGVGGVSDFSDLLEFWREGGKVLQIYTSYVFQGPAILHRFQKQIHHFLAFQGIYQLQDFLALDVKEKRRRINGYLHSQ